MDFNNMESHYFKNEIIRAFILAQSLEPLADKPGCTTRFVDSSPGTKLEYFILSAVNSAGPIKCLISRILNQGKMPECVFDAAYEAQKISPRNRYGGKVNYAQILMLMPILISQCLLHIEKHIKPSTETILRNATSALMQTTTKDVESLQSFVDLSSELSNLHHKRLGTSRKQFQPVFKGQYSTIYEATNAPDFSITMMAKEMKNGYPRCLELYNEVLNSPEIGLLKKSEDVYKRFLPAFGRHDVIADCLVVVIYLILIQYPDKVWFP